MVQFLSTMVLQMDPPAQQIGCWSARIVIRTLAQELRLEISIVMDMMTWLQANQGWQTIAVDISQSD